MRGKAMQNRCYALNVIRSQFGQLSHMEDHCNRITKQLDVLLECTYAAAPRRTRGYLLNRVPKRIPSSSQRERLLERAIWENWNKNRRDTRFSNAVKYIQILQMPLQGRRADKRWGKIDLVGVSNNFLPVVIELKKEESPDTPLTILIEALAYAVALRRAWNEGNLADEWGRHVCKRASETHPLVEVPIVGLAPRQYWDARIGTSGRTSKGKVPENAWKPFAELCRAILERGFPIQFLECRVGALDPRGLPEISGISNVQLPSG